MNEEDFSFHPEVIPFEELLQALRDEERVFAPRYLYRLSDLPPHELRALKSAWKEISFRRRQALMEDLEHLTDTNTLLSYELIFRFALDDEDDRVRFCALRAIEVFDTDDLVSTFLVMLEEDESVDVRALAASVLGKYIYRGEVDKLPKTTQEEIENTLLAVIDSGAHPRVRRHALEALGYSPREEVYRLIREAYQSEEEPWVASALFAMGRSYDHCWDENVLDRLQDPSPVVRAEAVRACGELDLEDAVPDIIDMLDDVPTVREAAIWALSQIGGEGAGEALLGLLEEPLLDSEVEFIESALQNLSYTLGGIDYTIFAAPTDEDENGDMDLDLDDDWLF